MKRLFFSFLAIVAFAWSASAQDVNAAIEAYNAGATAAKEQNYAVAIENLNKAIDIVTEMQSALGEGEELSEEALKVMVDSKNLIPTLHLNYAKQLFNDGNKEEAVAQAKLAIETSQKYDDEAFAQKDAKEFLSDMTMQEANDAMNAKDFAKAIEGYTAILADDPENAVATLRLGQAKYSAGDVQGAIEPLTKAMEMGQEEQAAKILSNIYVKVAQASLKAKKFTEAIGAAEKSIGYKENANALKIAANAYQNLKQFAKALENWKKLKELDPNAKDIAQTNYCLAVCYEGVGNKKEACAHYKLLLNDAKFKEMATYKVKTELKCE